MAQANQMQMEQIKNKAEELQEIVERIKLNDVAETMWKLLQTIKFAEALRGIREGEFHAGPFKITVYNDRLTLRVLMLGVDLEYRLVSKKDLDKHLVDAGTRTIISATKAIAEDIVRLKEIAESCGEEEYP